MPQDDSRFERGLDIRTAVLGGEHVAASMAGGDEFMAPLQRHIVEYCWGDVWARPGLDRRTRSLLNLGMLTALGKMEELRLHVGGALRNGCTEAEIQEALLQATVYCGVPAGLSAFRVARDVLAEQGGGTPPAGD